MEELIKIVTQKAGISETQARQAVQTVLGFLKGKLPGSMFGQVERAFKGEMIQAKGILAKLGLGR